MQLQRVLVSAMAAALVVTVVAIPALAAPRLVLMEEATNYG